MARTNVIGTFYKANDVPCEGTLSFQLINQAYREDINITFNQSPVVATLANGLLDVDLEPTDDADWNVTGLLYKVTQRFVGYSDLEYYIAVPTSGTAVDIGDLIQYPDGLSIQYVPTPGVGFGPAFSKGGSLSVETGTFRLYNDNTAALTITSVRASVGTAPTGANLIVDVHKNGTTIFTTQASRPQIIDGEFTDVSAAPDVTSWGVGEYLTVDVDQVGSTIAGADLVVQVAFE